jgi:hypothetical protein
MSAGVIHVQRLAWDGARAFVGAIAQGEASLVSSVLGARLDPAYSLLAEQTWYRLATDPERVNTEMGLWRARLHDLADARPELRDRLQETIAQFAQLVAG